MSFGFSIGDFLAVGKLVAEIITSLQDAGGAKSDYQDLIRELECLGEVLRRLDQLQAQNTNTKTLESIKYAALSCQRPLEDFLGKIRRYEDTLGVRARPNIFGKSSVHKIRWSLGKKEEVARLQSYLCVHIGAINILLSEYGLETLQVTSRNADSFHVHVQGTLEGMQRTMRSIEGNLEAQRQAVKANNSMLTTLYQMVCGDISTGMKSLMGIASAVCVTTQQIYGILLEIKSSFHVADARWTWFQEPFKVEDALGIKFPIPAEYNFDLIHVIIKTRFQNGPGSQDVRLGNYELVQARNSSQAISARTFLRPGAHIIMAIIIDKHDDGAGKIACPMRHCGSTRTTLVYGGGRVCSECQVWFGESTRKRKRVEDLAEQEKCQSRFLSTEASSEAHCGRNSKPPKRPSLPDEETEAYKNVRYAKPSDLQNAPAEEDATESEDANTDVMHVDKDVKMNPSSRTPLQKWKPSRHAQWTPPPRVLSNLPPEKIESQTVDLDLSYTPRPYPAYRPYNASFIDSETLPEVPRFPPSAGSRQPVYSPNVDRADPQQHGLYSNIRSRAHRFTTGSYRSFDYLDGE